MCKVQQNYHLIVMMNQVEMMVMILRIEIMWILNHWLESLHLLKEVMDVEVTVEETFVDHLRIHHRKNLLQDHEKKAESCLFLEVLDVDGRALWDGKIVDFELETLRNDAFESCQLADRVNSCMDVLECEVVCSQIVQLL